jgi:outer membrane protein OmpA-like peptidoglycan-associated protein
MRHAAIGIGMGVLLLAGQAQAAGPGADAEASGEASVALDGDGAEGKGKTKKRGRLWGPDDPDDKSLPWIKRHGPRRNSWHLGVAGGVFLPSRGLDLRAEGAPFTQFERVAGDVAFRVGYYPLRLLGIEVEGTVMPGGQTLAGESAMFWSARGQLILQLPFWRIVPFASLGGGGLGLSSNSIAGDDVDGFWAWGGGLKFHINRYVGLRFDVRTNLSPKFTDPDFADSEEVLLGVVVRLGPKRKKAAAPEPGDRDGDGFKDPDDKCPDDKGVAPDGCPVGDRDKDGFKDPDDKCPDEKGIAPDGCPTKDRDGDGFLDDDDKCPDEAGVEPDGCPIGDKDSDGFMDPDDKCVEEPETVNGFEDEDGCPDEVPKDAETFTGVIEGILFDTGKATIKKASRARLDQAVDVLQKYPSIRIEISGHTDSTGSREVNMDLSQRRAEAVKTYLVDKGVDTARVETRGAGPDEPIDSNTSKAGRSKNRRIEFKILAQ